MGRKLEGGAVDRLGPAVVIDPGHGGVDGGTVGLDGLLEKDAALAISFLVRGFLEEEGVRVVMTREGDVTMGVRERADFANREPRRALVSIHLNSGPPGARGTETLFSHPKALEAQVALRQQIGAAPGAEIGDTRGDMLAAAVQQAVCMEVGSRDRGTKNRPGLGVTRRPHCPAVLIETGFVSDPEENRRLGSAAYQRRLARGIADGVLVFLREVELHPDYGVRVVEAR